MKAQQQRQKESQVECLTRLRLWLKYRVLLPLKGSSSGDRYTDFAPRPGSDAVVLGIDRHISSIATCLQRGDIETFLKRLSEMVQQMLSGALLGRALFIPELDELARQASLLFAPLGKPTRNPELLVHVASVVHPIGGHTRVIEDIAAALPEYRHELIVTDMAHLAPMELAPLIPRFEKLGLKVHILKASRWAERAQELSSLVAALGPQAVLLFAHYGDSVAFVGVEGNAANRVIFLHHCDHMPALGATRKDYTHIDLTPDCHRFCASRVEPQAFLLNLTVKESGTARLVKRHPIIGSTCGRQEKYQGESDFSYSQLLAALFSAGVGRLLHIGDLPEKQREEICANIRASGQDAGRVTFLPNVPSLSKKLIELSPDFFLVSHPVVGGKATVEAMSVGLPILFARPVGMPPLLNVDMTFGTSVEFSHLAQIPAAVRRLETEKLRLAANSRAVYERHYAPWRFREALLSAIGARVGVAQD